MMNLFKPLQSLLRKLRHDTSGAAVMFVAAGFVTTLGSAAFVIDLGNATVARHALQASTDAAALAGAAEINCCTAQPGKALVTARNYTAETGKLNATAKLSITTPSTIQLKCLASTGVSCTGPDSANAIVVRQQGTVPMNFAKVFGISTLDVSAVATAASNAGRPKPLDVMILLDTTASMNTADPSCSFTATRLQCALAGARTLIATLSPSVDKIGMMTYPGAASASEMQKNYNCNSDGPAPVAYKSNPVYVVLGLASDYRTSDNAATPDTSSNLVKAFGGGATGWQARHHSNRRCRHLLRRRDRRSTE